jgi:ketosteroid isomerase-like protein
LRDLGEGRVLAELQVAGRAKLSGAETDLTYAAVYTVRGGKIVRGREYKTVGQALDAAGVAMPEGSVEVVRRFVDAVGDLPASLACLDPDVQWIPLRAATEGAYHGHEGYERFYDDTFESFESFEPQFELRELPEGRVLAWGTILVRGMGSGVEIQVPTGGIFEVRGGKVTRWEDFGSKEKALDAARLRE